MSHTTDTSPFAFDEEARGEYVEPDAVGQADYDKSQSDRDEESKKKQQERREAARKKEQEEKES